MRAAASDASGEIIELAGIRCICGCLPNAQGGGFDKLGTDQQINVQILAGIRAPLEMGPPGMEAIAPVDQSIGLDPEVLRARREAPTTIAHFRQGLYAPLLLGVAKLQAPSEY